jgi:hypothetical protein
MDYHKKYLKYKLKYLNIKNMIKHGGNLDNTIKNPTLPTNPIDNIKLSDNETEIKNIINPTLPNNDINNFSSDFLY